MNTLAQLLSFNQYRGRRVQKRDFNQLITLYDTYRGDE